VGPAPAVFVIFFVFFEADLQVGLFVSFVF